MGCLADGLHEVAATRGVSLRASHKQRISCGIRRPGLPQRFACAVADAAAVGGQAAARPSPLHGATPLRLPPGIVWQDLPTRGTDPPPPIGPIQSWRDFDAYPWPTVDQVGFSEVEWLEENLPDNMGLWSTTHVFQWVSNLIGFTPLCTMLYEDRELIRAVTARVGQLCVDYTAALCDFSRVGAINVADDLGHRTASLIRPDDIREFFVPWQSQAIAAAKGRGKLGIFHVCGHVDEIMRDLIGTVGIDAKHSTQDTIEPIQETRAKWGGEVGLLGGVDIDFATRARPAEMAAYTRKILEDCVAGGGFALGLGNWVADSVPLENFLAMLRAAREFA